MRVMRRSWLQIFLLILFIAGCTSEFPTTGAEQAASPLPTKPADEATTPAGELNKPTVTNSVPTAPAPTEEPTLQAVATVTLQPETLPPTATVTVAPPETPTVTPTVAGAEPPQDLSISPDGVYLHPVPDIYAGDLVTFYILAEVPPQVEPNDVTVRVEVRNHLSLQGALNGYNMAGNAIGLFAWAWDTTAYWGDHEVVVTLDPDDAVAIGDENPDNNQAVLPVTVQPTNNRPLRERNQRWELFETDCCVIRVVTGTAAHRDIEQIKIAADAAAQQALARLGAPLERKLDLYLIDRIFGQGGYATSNVVISYLDRNYAGGGFHEVLVHELTHLIDRQFAPDRIAFLAEGLAVWTAGGHYKQEDIDQRVKALRETNLYHYLPALIDDFYDSQHEVGYIQAAGFINYLVTVYGWEQTRDFYAGVHPQPGEPYTTAVERSLKEHFNLTLAQMEMDWMAYLDRLPRNGQAVSDVLTTVRYYDLMRDYQLRYDPTAHFLQAWLPYAQELEQRGLTAEVTRHPSGHINVTLEVMLYAVDRAIAAGDFNRANVILDSVARALGNDGEFIDPLGQNYSEIVEKLTDLGFEVHQVDLTGNEAMAYVTEGVRPGLRAISMALRNQDWVLLN